MSGKPSPLTSPAPHAVQPAPYDPRFQEAICRTVALDRIERFPEPERSCSITNTSSRPSPSKSPASETTEPNSPPTAEPIHWTITDPLAPETISARPRLVPLEL